MSVASATPRRGHPQRASHHTHAAVATEPSAPPVPDVFAHPAVTAFVANHPNRPIPKFGAYYMLQTLGEGEFGKVKLGIHSKYGEEVAVKLIRRETVDNEVKMAKIAREIEILDQLKHPNIVRLYDVYETDKFFGIILEYASGGELFDHILAHRYLRERDACKLFSQLVSGVWYMHQKDIVHRDLKLENLLLDRNRNLIITDFGFANRFDRAKHDLMETMCGSPCYAAPELVNSSGNTYVGTAADVWSCGVILYAMLSGYLPYDDDPTNPDAEDINKLYKYIANTPLTFPEHISDEACSLLSMMLVPDPRTRADLATVMRHRWFLANLREASTFGLTVKELERMAEDGSTFGRLAYQRGRNKRGNIPQKEQRSRDKRSDPPDGRNETSPSRSRRGEGAVGSPLKDTVGSPRKHRGTKGSDDKEREHEHEQGRKEERTRHTIQVGYTEGANVRGNEERKGSRRGLAEGLDVHAVAAAPSNGSTRVPSTPTREGRQRRTSPSSPGLPGGPTTRTRTPLAAVVFSALETTAERTPPSSTVARTDNSDDTVPTSYEDSGETLLNASSIRSNRGLHSHSNAPHGTINRVEAKTLLAPLVIDNPTSSPDGKQPFTPTTRRNLADALPPASASPSKPNKVMQWFRRGRRSTTVSDELSSNAMHDAAAASSVEVASIPHQHNKGLPPTPGTPAHGHAGASPFLVTPGTGEHRQRTTSAVSITSLFRRSAGVASGSKQSALRVHHGAVDHEMITAERPPQVMQHLREVLSEMGVDVQIEGDFKYRCSRPAKRRGRWESGGDAALNGTFSPSRGSGGVLRGLIPRGLSPRRQPSPARSLIDRHPPPNSPGLPPEPPSQLPETVYGLQHEDVGDEVRFSVEVTRLDRLKDMYSVDVRRLKGNLKSYKFLYDTLRTRVDLQR